MIPGVLGSKTMISSKTAPQDHPKSKKRVRGVDDYKTQCVLSKNKIIKKAYHTIGIKMVDKGDRALKCIPQKQTPSVNTRRIEILTAAIDEVFH